MTPGELAQGLSEVLTVLTRDPKFDIPLLEVALRLEQVAYVGAMGSRRTHDQGLAQLRWGGAGSRLSDRGGPIHHTHA